MITDTSLILERTRQHLKQHGDGWRVQLPGADPPPLEYGNYAAYDGVNLLAAGGSRDLCSSFAGLKDRLSEAALPVFIWRPDTDGTTREWLDNPGLLGDNAMKCYHCEGSGECVHCSGTGVR